MTTRFLWTWQIAVAAIFIYSGLLKLEDAPPMIDLFQRIGMGHELRYVIGALEIVAASMLLLPGFVLVGAWMLSGLMIGAMILHLLSIGGSAVPASLMLFALTVIISGRHGLRHQMEERAI